MTIPYPYDWIIALSLILFPVVLFAGLLLRHRQRIRQTQAETQKNL